LTSKFIPRISKHIKSQISFAIILGIVLIVLTGLVYYAFSKPLKEKIVVKGTGDTISQVKDYMESCLKSTLEDGILELGWTAGMYNLDRLPYFEDGMIYPYFYKSGKAMLPDLNVFEEELGLYVDDNIDICLNDFTDLKNQGIEISAGTPKTSTKITPAGATVVLDYPITASKQSNKFELKEFTASREARLMPILQSTNKIVQEITENPYFIPVQVMLDESQEKDLNMSVDVYEEDEVIIIYIKDYNTIIKGEPYTFVFAAIFNMSNIAPIISDMEPVIVKPGEDFIYVVPARDPENRVMAFFTNDTRFEIDMYTGVIETIIPSDLKGETRISIFASDGEATVTKVLVLRVESN